MTGCADINTVTVLGIDQDFCDVLSILQANVRPVLSAVSGLVNSISNRNAVPHPRLASADPNDFGICGINGDRSDGLHRLAVENRFEHGAAIHRLPNATAGRAYKHGEPSLLVRRVYSRNSSAHSGGADITGGQSGDGGSVKLDRLLSRRGNGQKQTCAGS